MKTLLHAFITSRIDYCNALLAEQPACLLDRLQLVQNSASRLFAGCPRRSHVAHILRDDLHWLRIPQRITYKLCTLVHRCLSGAAPAYLSELRIKLSDRPGCISRNRSAALRNLFVPRTRTKTYGCRSFRVSGPTSWNLLPAHLKLELSYNTIKRQLKTHLFNLSFS